MIEWHGLTLESMNQKYQWPSILPINYNSMREIKYRAYLKNAKVMADVNGINFGKEFILTSIWTRWEFSEIELMQYTWLKDENWVEIYEWDIYYVWINNDDKYQVFFHEWAFVWWKSIESCSPLNWGWDEDECIEEDFSSSMTVVWNIYEDKYLLNS